MAARTRERTGGWREWGVFAPRPRRWSSALTLAALAVLLAFVLPAPVMRTGSRGIGFVVYKVGGDYRLPEVRGADERWNVDLAWDRHERSGRVRGVMATTVRRFGPDGAPLAAPDADELRRALLVGAAELIEADPLFRRAVLSGKSVVTDWEARGVVAEVGHWAIKFMLLGALALGLVRMIARRSYERAIGAWYEGKCPSCGYVLEGISTERCPECGCVGEKHVKRLDGILRGR